MQEIDKIIDYLDQKKKTNTKLFLLKLLSKWYWFVIFGLIGLGVGYLVNKYSKPVYNLKSSLLVYPESQNMGLTKLFESFSGSFHTNIQNHIEILKSYSLNRQVLENLNWRVSWYRKGFLCDSGLYQKEPFVVFEDTNHPNITGIPLTITLLSDQTFVVRAKGKTGINGLKKTIEFEQEGRFGIPVKNKFFHFTLGRSRDSIPKTGVQFLFQFNDLNSMTLAYLKKLKISLSENKANLIRLQLKEDEPTRGVDYLNELNRVYIQFGLMEKNRISENTVRFIDAQVRGVVDSLQLAGQKFTNFRSQNRIIDLGEEARLIVMKLEELESEKNLAEMRLEYYRNLYNYLDDAKQMKDVVSPSVVGITDQTLNALVMKLSDLYGKREVLSYSVKDKNPSLLVLNREIQHVRKSLEENLENMLINAENEVVNLNKRMQRIKDQLTHLPQTEQQLINIKRRFDLNNELYTFLLKKRAEAAITKASNVSNVQILDSARIETVKKIWPKTKLILLAGLFLGFFLPFLSILYHDYFNDRLQSPEEVENISRLPLVGTIYHNRYRSEIPVKMYPRSGVSESFRSLRTNLRYMLSNDRFQVIAVHSTIPGEGKSFTAVNLATVIAMSNKKVLIVGVDMRKPRLGKIFNCNNELGLSSYLIKQSRFNEIIYPTDIQNLSCVISGPIPPNPAELLENGEFERFLLEAREHFDSIILDNAPILMVTDGILAGQHADVNLFVLRKGYSQKKQVKIINRISIRGAIPGIALVLNDISINGYHNRYGKFGKSYYYENKSWGAKLKFRKRSAPNNTLNV